jgi:hypothetical protein
MSSTFRVSHIIKDSHNNMILRGGNLIPLGRERLVMIGFVGGVFLPLVLIILLFFLSFDLLLETIPILFLLGTLWVMVYMSCYSLLFNLLRFHYKFQDANGNPFGGLESDCTLSRWNICDPDGDIHAILNYSENETTEFFTLSTPDGQYTGYYRYKQHLGAAKRYISSRRFKEIEVTDSNGVPVFSLSSYGRVIQSEGVLSPLITLLTGTCVASRLHQVWLQELASLSSDKPTRTVANIH